MRVLIALRVLEGLGPRIPSRTLMLHPDPKAGIDRIEYLRHAWYKRLHGCAYPGRNYVIRPNGAVSLLRAHYGAADGPAPAGCTPTMPARMP